MARRPRNRPQHAQGSAPSHHKPRHPCRGRIGHGERGPHQLRGAVRRLRRRRAYKAREDGEIELYLCNPGGCRKYDICRFAAKGRRACDRRIREVHQRPAEAARRLAEEQRRREGGMGMPRPGAEPARRRESRRRRRRGIASAAAAAAAAAASAGGRLFPGGARPPRASGRPAPPPGGGRGCAPLAPPCIHAPTPLAARPLLPAPPLRKGRPGGVQDDHRPRDEPHRDAAAVGRDCGAEHHDGDHGVPHV